ncbi:MAG TPA: DUF1707 domain-containing protein [Actinophytocola sp.]|uniref:DUF1707 SHOCT-like domain-containing protein n=1 Tax=Actinophytocola sp. TaxID=1872138 RepID=UPI002DDD6CAD|nr:DUF1707 domain-containing protein [Actinophytocola sp.]HEV2784658.1 DUF1707 domain-containing protein [Actinophytocola sp.]
MEIEPSDLRISDVEREDAISKLGEHLSVGRLGVDEYGERTAQVAAARTRGELLALFRDLPDPRPSFGQTLAASSSLAGGKPASWDERPLAQRLWAAAVPLSAIVAVILFFTLFKVWFVFLLPAAVAVVGGAIWGEDWRHDQHRWDHRRRRELGRGE